MLTIHKLAALGAFAAMTAASPAFAQEATPDCYQSGPYFVIAQQRSEDVGTDFIIKTLSKNAKAPECVFSASDGDAQLKDPSDALWFTGLAGRYLVMTRSTGPDGDVVIYDMKRNRNVVDVPADDEVTVADSKITYWQRTGEATAATCPGFAENTANGLGSVIAEEMDFAVTTGTSAPTGQSRCSSTQ